MAIVKDQLQRNIELNTVPKRIVSLVPSQTELLCDLGLEDAIVGITKFCVHPNHLLATKIKVGGTKQVHYEKIKALQPDIILCNKEENAQDMIQTLEGIAPVHISDIYTIEDSLELIRMYGVIFNISGTAQNLIEAIKKSKTEFEDFIRIKPLKTVAYFIWKSPWMVAANNTFINYMLALNRLDNVFANQSRYPEIDVNTIKISPDLVFLSSEPYPFNQNHINTVQTYLPNSKIVLVDGEMFSWYGSRLIKAFVYFKDLSGV
ncbi:ABC transporter substrate-binding protein [Formosa sediminum]|uniref:ABC transporter substrate-binding protein n=1 Tax=Formosa sediminum TaxID=2594004 RepID=A0A516GLW3_9FLAO|nr:helical backbone metal receptor [Formosa sediminum]QDO92465.1 ABC transporter substrate-binding protein [Formosa sediminum]